MKGVIYFLLKAIYCLIQGGIFGQLRTDEF